MIDASQIPELSREEIIKLVREDKRHIHFNRTMERAKIMKAWYNAQEHTLLNKEFIKQNIIRKSPIESNKDYNDRLENLDLLPFEHKFFHTQQRIYDENNVQRQYPEGTDFWKGKEAHFDDCGDQIDTFFRDKVLFTKEIEGFGAICFDLATSNGDTITVDGSPVPYPYIIQADELVYYDTWYGHLKVLVTAVVKGDRTEYRVFTPSFIYVFEDKNAEPIEVPHQFGRTPAIILKGAVDPGAGFKVGMPRRWNLTGLYKACSELFYDLKKGSQFFGHPIPVYPMSVLRGISGAWDDDEQKFNSQVVKEELGMIIPAPDDNMPNKLFHQADMQGLQHLRQVIFEDMVNLIYQMAQVRDKSKVVHNASGRSKQFDSVEEQGLLAQTASDMEAIEKDVFAMMAVARGQDPDDFNVVYSKHHDLSSADEIWTQFTEGMQYGGVPTEVKKYQVTEYLRKKSAPKEYRQSLADELERDGFPITKEQVDALKDRIDNNLLAMMAHPKLKDESFVSNLQETINSLGEELTITQNNP